MGAGTSSADRSPDQRAPQTQEEASMKRSGVVASVLLAGLGLAAPLHAQDKIYMPAVLEESGPGAVSGTNFRDGLRLAVEGIHAQGGIHGQDTDKTVFDNRAPH